MAKLETVEFRKIEQKFDNLNRVRKPNSSSRNSCQTSLELRTFLRIRTFCEFDNFLLSVY